MKLFIFKGKLHVLNSIGLNDLKYIFQLLVTQGHDVTTYFLFPKSLPHCIILTYDQTF